MPTERTEVRATGVKPIIVTGRAKLKAVSSKDGSTLELKIDGLRLDEESTIDDLIALMRAEECVVSITSRQAQWG